MSASPITAAKTAQDYVSATQRNRCGNCQHVKEAYAGVWQCRKGAFLVTVYAVCKLWEVKQPPGFRAPTS